jgi:hypothetical protein
MQALPAPHHLTSNLLRSFDVHDGHWELRDLLVGGAFFIERGLQDLRR